jgi:hypothetical protein
MRKGKDPDPEPYLKLMDPDPGDPKNTRIRIPNTGSLPPGFRSRIQTRFRIQKLKQHLEVSGNMCIFRLFSISSRYRHSPSFIHYSSLTNKFLASQGRLDLSRVVRNNFATPNLHKPFKMTSVADLVLELHNFGYQDPDLLNLWFIVVP